LVFLGLSVLDLGPMYATDRRGTDRTVSDVIMPPPKGRGHNNGRTKSFSRFHSHGFNFVRLSADHSTTVEEMNTSTFVVGRRMVVAWSNRNRVAVVTAALTITTRLFLRRIRADNWVMGQQIWVGHGSVPVTHFYIVLIRHPTWFSGSRKTDNGNWNCYLLVPFHILCNSVARDEQTSEKHRFPWEGQNSVEILVRKINW